MRYGHQPWGDLMRMSVEELFEMADEIITIVRQENDANAVEPE